MVGRSSKSFAIPLVLSLFFMWGVANNLNDVLIQQFKKAFTLSDLQAGLVQSAFYAGYFITAIPAAYVMRRFSYKISIVSGLVLFGVGCLLFYPAAEALTYTYFLIALFVMAIGLAFLETAANPFVIELGDAETASRRLNFAQAFNPLGSITGVVIGRQFIFSAQTHSQSSITAMTPSDAQAFHEAAAKAVELPYLVIGAIVLVWALLFSVSKLSGVHGDGHDFGRSFSLPNPLRHRHLGLAVVAQFFYVGAQVGVWSFLIRYTLVEIPGISERAASNFLIASLVLFFSGRFITSLLMKYIKALKLLAIYSAINIVLMVAAMTANGLTGVVSVVAASFFMSIMYPTIFSSGLYGLKENTKSASSLLVMAIIGGAVLTAAMGFVSDQTNIKIAYAVPMVSFLVILVFALISSKFSPSQQSGACNEIAVH